MHDYIEINDSHKQELSRNKDTSESLFGEVKSILIFRRKIYPLFQESKGEKYEHYIS